MITEIIASWKIAEQEMSYAEVTEVSTKVCFKHYYSELWICYK